MKNTLFITLFLATVAFPASGQILKETKTPAIKTAIQTGQLAGAGYFCQVNNDALDDLITLSHARIALQAIDKVDRVVAQLEFSNNYSAWSARPPEEGCEIFRQNFIKNVKTLFQRNKGPEGP